MVNLNHLFKIGQQVIYYDDSFDAINHRIECVVKQILDQNTMVITDTQTNTDLYVEQGFNLDKVYPVYNF